MKLLFTFYMILFSIQVGVAQSKRCATMSQLEIRMQNNPELKKRIEQSEHLIQQLNTDQSKTGVNVISIPVVVHVVWNQAVQNISEAQIVSQIAILNQDFRLLNTDALPGTHPYAQVMADAEIEFCLATVDPQGNPTTGITRTQTNVSIWNDNNADNLKNSALGGKNNWDPTKYLNLYVANLESGVLGFATFPDELQTSPELDGVVIRHQVFGSVGTAGTGGYSDNDQGRTATHEVGHWLFLRHIWGDESCGNDFVNDTPVAEEENYFCPTFPHNANNACGTGANGEMYMNYMDYVDDACMNMFTAGQKVRMRNTITQLRPGLLSSTPCGTKSGIDNESFKYNYQLFPNPSQKDFYVDFGNVIPVKVTLINLLGEKLIEINSVHSTRLHLNLNEELGRGLYIIDVDFGGNQSVRKKIVIE